MSDSGLDRMNRRFAAVLANVRTVIQPALMKSGEELAGMMRQLAPEDSGDLKASIAVTAPGQSTPPYSQPGGSRTAKDNEVLITAGDEKTRYPHLVEFGTKTALAQPYFWPAFRLLRTRVQNRTKRAIRKAVRDGWSA